MLPHHNPHPPHAHPMHPRSAPVTPRQEASAPTLGDSPPLPPYLIGTMGPPPPPPQQQQQQQQGTPRPTTVGGFEGPPSGPSPVRGEEAGAAWAGAGGDANGAGGLPFFQRLRIG
jgi:hypothetical protein